MKNDTYDLNNKLLSAPGEPAVKPLACDPEKYREYLDEFDCSEEEQTELLQILWSIMAAFVEMGFGVDSIQFLPTEAQEAEADEKKPHIEDPGTDLPPES
ncbi:MAG: hypothetical protein DBP01_05225 [gamma proteobacterium symbiont of Ctena orbiculata]|nr:MAG: hypothetical protein DBP01_05225 [gamma proteobacterium symbiont of Ctena orbiculata]